MVLVTDLREHLSTCEVKGKYDESEKNVPTLLSTCTN